MEREFIMIKPDGVHRGLIGETIARIERARLQSIGRKMLESLDATVSTTATVTPFPRTPSAWRRSASTNRGWITSGT